MSIIQEITIKKKQNKKQNQQKQIKQSIIKTANNLFALFTIDPRKVKV